MTEAGVAQPDPRLLFFNGLLGYLEDRSWALAKVRTSPNGSSLFDLRVHHRLYLQSLLSAVDHVKDFLVGRPEVLARFEAAIKNGNDNFEYIRELRNAVLHRGLDLTGAAHSSGDTLWVICPRDVKNQRGTKVFQSPFKYFRRLADYCEEVCNSAFSDVLAELDLFNPATHLVSNEHLQAFVRNNPDIPEEAKDTILAGIQQSITPDLLERVAKDRITQVKELLEPKPENSASTPPSGI